MAAALELTSAEDSTHASHAAAPGPPASASSAAAAKKGKAARSAAAKLSAQALAQGEPAAIEELDLSWNGISGVAAIVLFRGLQNNATIKVPRRRTLDGTPSRGTPCACVHTCMRHAHAADARPVL